MARLVVCFASLGAIGACGDRPEDSAIVTRHPVADQLLSSTSAGAAASASGSAEAELLALLAERSSDQRYGEAEGDVATEFGELLDGTLLPDGRMLLLDGSYGLVRVLDGPVAGSAVGGLGEGPGSFVEPIRVVTRGDSLAVLDRARAIHVLTLPRTGVPTWVRTIRLSIDAEDACEVNGSLVALAPPVSFRDGSAVEFRADAGVLHRLSDEGVVTGSFHVPYRTASRVVAQSFASGRLLCDPEDESIIAAFSSLGEVHRLSPSGEVRWITRLPNYSYPPLEEQATGAVGPARDFSGPIDQVRTLAHLTDSLLVVSITSTAIWEPGRPRTHRLAVLRMDDGAFLGHVSDDSIAAVLFGNSSETLVYRDLPHPEVTRIRRGQDVRIDGALSR